MIQERIKRSVLRFASSNKIVIRRLSYLPTLVTIINVPQYQTCMTVYWLSCKTVKKHALWFSMWMSVKNNYTSSWHTHKRVTNIDKYNHRTHTLVAEVLVGFYPQISDMLSHSVMGKKDLPNSWHLCLTKFSIFMCSLLFLVRHMLFVIA